LDSYNIAKIYAIPVHRIRLLPPASFRLHTSQLTPFSLAGNSRNQDLQAALTPKPLSVPGICEHPRPKVVIFKLIFRKEHGSADIVDGFRKN
jgi:hypothetical protein